MVIQVSLGFYEQHQLDKMVTHLTRVFNIGQVALWGRSMGAVTALLFAEHNSWRVSAMVPRYSSQVLDSPFGSLLKMVQELAYEHYTIPSFVVSMAIKLINSNIEEKIHVDLFEKLRPSRSSKHCSAPAIFLAAAQDGLVKPDKTRELFEKYGSKVPLSESVIKQYLLCEGGHNDSRDPETIERCMKFISNEFFARHYSSAELDRKLNDMTRYRRVKRTIHNSKQKKVRRTKQGPIEASLPKTQSGDSHRTELSRGLNFAAQGSSVSMQRGENCSQLKPADQFVSRPAESLLVSKPPKPVEDRPVESNYRSQQQHRRNQSNGNFTSLLNHQLFKTVDETPVHTALSGIPSRIQPAKKLNMTRKGSLSSLGAQDIPLVLEKPKVLMETTKTNQKELVSDHISKAGSFRRQNTTQSNRIDTAQALLFDSMKPEPSKPTRNDRIAEIFMSRPSKQMQQQKENTRPVARSKVPNQDFSLISDIHLIDQFLTRNNKH